MTCWPNQDMVHGRRTAIRPGCVFHAARRIQKYPLLQWLFWWLVRARQRAARTRIPELRVAGGLGNGQTAEAATGKNAVIGTSLPPSSWSRRCTSSSKRAFMSIENWLASGNPGHVRGLYAGLSNEPLDPKSFLTAPLGQATKSPDREGVRLRDDDIPRGLRGDFKLFAATNLSEEACPTTPSASLPSSSFAHMPRQCTLTS